MMIEVVFKTGSHKKKEENISYCNHLDHVYTKKAII